MSKNSTFRRHANKLHLVSWLCTCVCFCSSSSCGSRDGCPRRTRRQPSEALGPAASSPHLLYLPGWARSLGSGDLGRRRFPCRCLPHLTGHQTTAQTQCQKVPKTMKEKLCPTLIILRKLQKQLTFFIHVIRYPTECTYCLQIKTESAVSLVDPFSSCSKWATNILCDKAQKEQDLLQRMWQMTCWIDALLPWISYSSCQSYYWSSC